MDIEKLGSYCFIDKNYKYNNSDTEPELLIFDEKKWKKRFPVDIKKDVDLTKLQLTNTGLYSIALPHISEALINLILNLCKMYKLNKNKLYITESNGGVGGFSIRLATHFNYLNIVEINDTHIGIIKNNIKVYDLDNKKKKINIIEADYLDVMFTLNNDIIICDPPWGGVDYINKQTIKLGFNNINIICIINELLKKNSFKIFILYAPRNFNIQQFVFGVNTSKISIDKFSRFYFITIFNLN